MFPIKVLICGADPAALTLLTNKLTIPDFQLLVIMDSGRLFEMIRTEHPDRIILGNQSAGLPFSAILDALRNDPETAGIPVIVYSNLPQHEELAREHGAEYFRSGNADNQDLVLVVRGRE